MDEKEENKKVLYPEWTISEPIELDDICVLESTGQEYLCSKIIPYGKYEYLYFGWDSHRSNHIQMEYQLWDRKFFSSLLDRLGVNVL